jgi:hypothetical protein
MRQDPSGDDSIELGSDASCKDAGLPKGKGMVSGEIIRERGKAHLNCNVTKEKIRA